MPLHVRFGAAPGRSLGYSVRRIRTADEYDHADGLFRPTAAAFIAALPEGTGADAGRYAATLDPTPVGTWTDDWYEVAIHDEDAAGATIQLFPVAMVGGDDLSLSSGGGGSGGGGSGGATAGEIAAATWAYTLHGSITAGRALWVTAASASGDVGINVVNGVVTIKGPDHGAVCITSVVTYPGNRTNTVVYPF
jgi:hypothetical protein